MTTSPHQQMSLKLPIALPLPPIREARHLVKPLSGLFLIRGFHSPCQISNGPVYSYPLLAQVPGPDILSSFALPSLRAISPGTLPRCLPLLGSTVPQSQNSSQADSYPPPSSNSGVSSQSLLRPFVVNTSSCFSTPAVVRHKN